MGENCPICGFGARDERDCECGTLYLSEHDSRYTVPVALQEERCYVCGRDLEELKKLETEWDLQGFYRTRLNDKVGPLEAKLERLKSLTEGKDLSMRVETLRNDPAVARLVPGFEEILELVGGDELRRTGRHGSTVEGLVAATEARLRAWIRNYKSHEELIRKLGPRFAWRPEMSYTTLNFPFAGGKAEPSDPTAREKLVKVLGEQPREFAVRVAMCSVCSGLFSAASSAAYRQSSLDEE